jgi:hypothetical protein
MNQCPPGPQVFHLGRLEFVENSRRFSRMNFNRQCQQFIAGVINPCNGEITKKPKIFRRRR